MQQSNIGKNIDQKDAGPGEVAPRGTDAGPAGGELLAGGEEAGVPEPALVLPELSAVSPLLNRGRRIYVNRNLRMQSISVVGFDMDYTLCQYNPVALESMSVEKTLEKLQRRGYPERIGSISYDSAQVIRGLVIDKKLGNIFKMDRHRHVGRVLHGFRLLEREERARLYRKDSIRLSAPRYHLVDTLYGLPEAYLFAAMVDIGAAPGRKRRDFARLFGDIRDCIDEAHRDGSINDQVVKEPERYIIRDEELASTLHKLRSAGKKLFLMTNSNWQYTRAVMEYLLGDSPAGYGSWQDFFDVVIVSANKPGFFNRNELFLELDTDGRVISRNVQALSKGRIYQGGNIREFERLTGAGADSILYVGDHIYGDVLRAKKNSAWRTAMIIQEMEGELARSDEMKTDMKRLAALEEERHRLDSEINFAQYFIKSINKAICGNQECADLDRDERENGLADADGGERAGGEGELRMPSALNGTRREWRRQLDLLKRRLRQNVQEHHLLTEKIEEAFNRNWGRLFKEGDEHSAFGGQVEEYACLYTSRVSNFLWYSPCQYFRTPRDLLPHEHL